MRRSKKTFALIMALCMTLVMGLATVSVSAATKKPKKIYLTAIASTVDIKGHVTVKVKKVTPSKASKAVTWKTSNKKVATVNSKGVVTGKKKGTVKITAVSKSNKKVKAVKKITVKDLKSTSVKLSATKLEINRQDSKVLKATVKGAAGFYNQGVTWKSSNTKVATVDSKGTVKALTEGTVTITATEKGGSRKASCEVTVVKAPTCYVSPQDVYSNLTKGTYVLLDSRMVADYKTAHIPTSVSASVAAALGKGTEEDGDAAANVKAVVDKYGKNKKYVIICYSGNSYAVEATEQLINAGVNYNNICTLGDENAEKSSNGGMKGWNAKYPNYVAKTYTSDKGKNFNDGITVEQLQADLDGNARYTIVDVRSQADYDAAHVPTSVSAPVTDAATAEANLKAVADANPNAIFAIVCVSGNGLADNATNILRDKLGVDEGRIITVEGGFNQWAAESRFSVSTADETPNYKSVQEVYDNLGTDEYVLVDARKTADYKTAHIPTAVSASVDSKITVDSADADANENIDAMLTKYGSDKKYVVICYSGNRYAKAASAILRAKGISNENIFTMQGGMKSWNASYADYTVKSYKSTSGFDFNDGVTVAQLQKDVAGAKKYTVLDVRSTDNYNVGHIEGSIHAESLTVDEAEANLKSVVEANPNAVFALFCNSGNGLAKNALEAMRDKLDVEEGRIVVVEGGAKDWKGDYVAEAVVDPAAKTVTIPAKVSNTTEKTMHYVVNAKGAMASKAIMTTNVSNAAFYDALTSLNAQPWNSKETVTGGKEEGQAGNTPIKDLVGKVGNADYSKVEVSVASAGNTYAMADTLKDGPAAGYDMIYANRTNNANAQFGCITCVTSCYSGMIANQNVSWASANYSQASDVLKKGDVVYVTYTLK